MSMSNFASSHHLRNPSNRRAYQFGIHGRSDHWSNFHRCRSLIGEAPRSLLRDLAVRNSLGGRDLVLADIAQFNQLKRAYRRLHSAGGQSPGLDGFTYGDFELFEIHAILRGISREILAGQYRPQMHRLVRIPRDTLRFRELQLRGIADRIVSKSVYWTVNPRIDRTFLDGSFAYRVRRSVHQLLAALEQAMLTGNHFWIMHDDVRNAFPTVRIDDVLADFRGHIRNREILELIQRILQGHDATRSVGIDQGDALSPLALNLRLHNALDTALEAAGADWFRYSDNIAIIGERSSFCEEAMRLAARRIELAGMQLKGEMPQAVNLRRAGSSIRWLGFEIRFADGRLGFGLSTSALENLSTRLDGVWDEHNPAEYARWVIRGWAENFGPAFEQAERAHYCRRIRRITNDLGFREGISDERICAWMTAAHRNWQRMRDSVSDTNA